MSFLAPGFFFASLGVAAAIVALHFIVTRQPRASILPTARFVPDTRATTVARARRPSDPLLMLLRVLTALAAGAGLAKPVVTPSRGAEARVILVDVSRSARDSMATRDSAHALYRNGDAVVVFDSSARVVTGKVADTLGALRPTNKRGNLGAALIAALRAGSSLRDHADSLELVIVSPFAREELDAATDSIRRLWPGRARLVRTREPATDSADLAGNVEIITEASDPLSVTVALARVRASGVGQRAAGVGNRESGAAPRASGVGRRASGLGFRVSATGPRVEWPAFSRPRFAVERAVKDTVGGVMSGDAAVVSTFERRWSFPADSLLGADVVARWVDGEPAAIEKPDGPGCIRSVAVPVSPVGDLVIRNDFVRFVTSLSAACAATTSLTAADPNRVARLEGKSGLAPRAAFQPLTDARSDLAPWLFALALATAMGELLVRRRKRDINAITTEKSSASSEARAA